jgi:hypothetical protein
MYSYIRTRQDETAFVAPSGFLRGFFTHPSGVLRELPKDSGRIPEGFPKKTIKKQETETKNIYFTEPLHALCNFAFIQPHFCDQQSFRHRR